MSLDFHRYCVNAFVCYIPLLCLFIGVGGSWRLRLRNPWWWNRFNPISSQTHWRRLTLRRRPVSPSLSFRSSAFWGVASVGVGGCLGLGVAGWTGEIQHRGVVIPKHRLQRWLTSHLTLLWLACVVFSDHLLEREDIRFRMSIYLRRHRHFFFS